MMIKFPKEAGRIEPNPFDYWDEKKTKRSEEIRQQAVKDVRETFRTLREQWKESNRTDSSSKDSN